VEISTADKSSISWLAGAVCIVAATFVIGLFFMRPNMGEPDSYREALSAIRYIDKGIYSSYWDHPLTMYIFVAGTLIARALNVEQVTVLNLFAVIFGTLSVWAFLRLSAELLNRRVALFASAGLMLSPNFLEFSTYLSHEIVGFAFALWAVFLFVRLLKVQRRTSAFVFGLLFAASWCARPSSIFFISPPLVVLLLFHLKEQREWAILPKLAVFAVFGMAICFGAVYRPALVRHLSSYSSNFLATYYAIGKYYQSSTMIAISAMTPVLLGLMVLSLTILLIRKRYMLSLFAASWILSPYAFYTGMYSMHRYFLVLLPPALLLVFAAADEMDVTSLMMRWKSVQPAKAAALLLLLLGALGPKVPDLLYARQNNDDKDAAIAIGEAVGDNLLFTTAPEPMLLYYNREHPPETVYLVTEYRPGIVAMKMDMLNLAKQRLRQGRPVFATGEILRQFQYAHVSANSEAVLDFHFGRLNRMLPSLQLFRLTSLEITGVSSGGKG